MRERPTKPCVTDLINLYRRYQDKDALQLDQQAIELLQIAARYFYKDRDDAQSQDYTKPASKLYEFLVADKKTSDAQAKILCDALLHHDAGIYGISLFCAQDKVAYDSYVRGITNATNEKNIYLIQHPETKQWELHQENNKEVVIVSDSDLAKELQQINKYNYLYYDQRKLRLLLKDHPATATTSGAAVNIYQKILHDAMNLAPRGNVNDLYFYQQIAAHDEQAFEDICRLRVVIESPHELKDEVVQSDKTDFNTELRAGKYAFRGVPRPSAVFEGGKENMIEAELKYQAQAGGNPARSVTLIVNGMNLFSNAGLIYRVDKVSNISRLSPFNMGPHGDRSEQIFSSQEDGHAQVAMFVRHAKMGGSYQVKEGKACYYHNHNEVLYDITDKPIAVCYSKDPNSSNYLHTSFVNPQPVHPHAPLCEAIFIQQQYFKLHKVKLPLVEYSSGWLTAKVVEQPTDEQMITQWSEMCVARMEDLTVFELHTCSVEQIKIMAVYKYVHVRSRENQSADTHYSDALIKAIDAEIENQRSMIIAKLRKEVFKYDSTPMIRSLITSPKQFFMLHFHPDLLTSLNVSALIEGIKETDTDMVELYQSGDRNVSADYYDRRIVKVYRLTELLNLADEQKRIQESVCQCLHSDLLATHSSIELGKLDGVRYKINKVISECKVFEIEDKLKDGILNTLAALVKVSDDKSLPNTLSYLDELGLRDAVLSRRAPSSVTDSQVHSVFAPTTAVPAQQPLPLPTEMVTLHSV